MRPIEVEKSHDIRLKSGFYRAYMTGRGLDIGYKGYGGKEEQDVVLDGAIGVDLDFPNYDGVRLPFEDRSLDYVFASHVLEHVPNPIQTIQDWFRVIRLNGHLVMTVPHKYLYEKRESLPSQFNADHKMFFTPAVLLLMIEQALKPNTYRIAHLRDNDAWYNYDLDQKTHPVGCYEIECVLRKIEKKPWN